MRYHGVPAAPGGVRRVAERVVLWCWLREPNVTTVATELAGLEGLGDILLDDDGTTGGVDEPCACNDVSHRTFTVGGGVLTLLHLGDQLLVEQATSLLVQRAVDSDNIALRQHLLEILDTPAADLLLLLSGQGLVVVVEQLLAVERLETPQDTLTDTANGNGTDNLVLKVVLVLGDGSDVPVTTCNLLVSGDEVADQDEHGHDDVLCNGDNVGTSDLGHGDTAVGLVGGIEVDVVGPDTSGNGELQLLGLGQTLGGEVTGVEAVRCATLAYVVSIAALADVARDLRGGDDDLGVNQFLVELGVLALLVGSGDQGVALLLDPLPQTELVLGRTKELGLLLRVLTALRRERLSAPTTGSTSPAIASIARGRHVRTS